MFCRFTQLGFLRLLTAEAVMSDEVMSRAEAWAVYDRWLHDNRVDLIEEPPQLETLFRKMTRSHRTAPKDWADSYLAAFAAAGKLTVVTLDRAFLHKTDDLLLLGE